MKTLLFLGTIEATAIMVALFNDRSETIGFIMGGIMVLVAILLVGRLFRKG